MEDGGGVGPVGSAGRPQPMGDEMCSMLSWQPSRAGPGQPSPGRVTWGMSWRIGPLPSLLEARYLQSLVCDAEQRLWSAKEVWAWPGCLPGCLPGCRHAGDTVTHLES